jgi:hypothetical protein
MKDSLSIKKSLSTPNHAALGFGVLLLAICWGISLHLQGLALTGPFIFGDEELYFNFARAIFLGKSLTSYHQYGPLYPALISPAFLLANTHKTYQFIRVFNICVFISAAIPAYLLAKELFQNQWKKIILPYCVLITAFNGLVYLVWAEPLYITLFYWSCFLLYRYIKKPTLLTGLLFAAFLSSLYYTKPPSGLVTQFAALLTLAAFLCFTWRTQPNKHKLFTLATILFSIAFIIPWVLFYNSLGYSPIGYVNATHEITQHAAAQGGYLHLLWNILCGTFYQFSYVFIGSWGMVGIVFIHLIMRWPYLNSSEKYITLFAVLCTLGLMAVSAIGMATYVNLDPKMSQGRYLSVPLPLLITLGVYFIFNAAPLKKCSRRAMWMTILITASIAIIATPFYTRSPLAFNSIPELSPYIFMSDKGDVIWRSTLETPSYLLRIGVPLFFAFFMFVVITFQKRTYTALLAILIIFSGALFSALTERYYIIKSSTSSFHSIYFYFQKHHIDMSSVRFEKNIVSESSNTVFLTQVWMNTDPILSSLDEIKNTATDLYYITSDKLAYPKVFSTERFTIYRINTTNHSGDSK